MVLRRASSHEDITALHDACRSGRLSDIKELLRRIDVDARDTDGATPLCVACEEGLLEVVQLLSAHGARRVRVREAAGLFAEEAAENHPHVLRWLRNSRMWTTALHHASVLQVTEVVELLRSGADVGARRYGLPTCPSPLDVAL